MDQQQKRSGLGGIGDGIRTGLGILGAFKDAMEETLQEAVDRGDLAPDRAREAMRDAGRRLQSVFDETRDRIEMVPKREHEELKAEVAALRDRLERLEREKRQERQDGRPDPAASGEGTTPSGIIVTD
jgi:polyhydroxyalkanoate synthesis regulator phasin